MNLPQVKPSKLDNFIGVFSPKRKNDRLKEKLKYAAMDESGFLVPGSKRNSMKGVNVSANSPDADTAPKLQGSRGMSRDLTMNAPLGSAAVKRARTNIIGPGLILQSTIDHEALGITEEQANAWEQRAEALFNLWGDDKKCDLTRRLDFASMQRLLVYSFLQNGDAFAIPVFKRPDNNGMWPFELRVRLVEADLVRNPWIYQEDYAKISGKDVVSGIENGPDGQMVAAWFANHYDNGIDLNVASHKFTRIPAHDINGRANFLHIFDPDRISQRRGMPFLAPVVNILKQITRLGEAELQASIVQSMFTVFIKDMDASRAMPNEAYNPNDAMYGGGSVPDENGQQVQQAKDAGHEWERELGAATITNLDDNKEIQMADPRKVSEGFRPFYDAMVMEMAAALEIPADIITLNFDSSYTASRAAFLEALKFYKGMRDFIVRTFCQPIYVEFLTEAIAKGWITAPGFMDDPIKRKLWSASQWIGPGNGQINPKVETEANILAIDNNLMTHSAAFTAVNGGAWEKMIGRRSREQKKIEKLGLTLEEESNEEQPPPEGDDSGGTNDE